MDYEKFVEKVQMDLAKILFDKYSNVIVEPGGGKQVAGTVIFRTFYSAR